MNKCVLIGFSLTIWVPIIFFFFANIIFKDKYKHWFSAGIILGITSAVISFLLHSSLGNIIYAEGDYCSVTNWSLLLLIIIIPIIILFALETIIIRKINQKKEVSD